MTKALPLIYPKINPNIRKSLGQYPHISNNMELTQTQMNCINYLLPCKYRLEQSSKFQSNTSKIPNRKSEAENLISDIRFYSKPPEKKHQPDPITTPPPENKFKSSESFKKLSKILADLKKHEKFSFFSSAYKDSFSLATVESRLNSGEYLKSFDFAMDIRKIWNNSFSSSAGNHQVYSATVDLSVAFEGLMRGNDNLVLEECRKVQEFEKPIKSVQVKSEPPKKVPERPLGFMEKKLLCQNIKKLEPRFFKGVLDIVRECMDMKGEELEFDIENLPPRVCRELDKYVKQCLMNSGKSKKKNTVEQIRTSQKETSNKIAQLDHQLESVVNGVKKDEVLKEESESESSSTSESEEEEVPSSSGFLQKDDEPSDFSGFGQMVDFDRIY